jgi:hypothetical protein
MINIIILILILITHVTRDFFKILVCPEIRTPNLRIARPTLYHCATAAHVKWIVYSCIYGVAYSIA